MRNYPDAVGTRTLRCPEDRIHGRKEPAFVSTPATTVLARLLPDATTLRLDACEVDEAAAQITLAVQSTQTFIPRDPSWAGA